VVVIIAKIAMIKEISRKSQQKFDWNSNTVPHHRNQAFTLEDKIQ
jgi:hypothetical protein